MLVGLAVFFLMFFYRSQGAPSASGCNSKTSQCGSASINQLNTFNLAGQTAADKKQRAEAFKRLLEADLVRPTNRLIPTFSFGMMDAELLNGTENLDPVPGRPNSIKRKQRSENGNGDGEPVRDQSNGWMSIAPSQRCWNVRISTGCTGTIIADRYVLTAAHCVTSGTRVVTPSSMYLLDHPELPSELPLLNSGLYEAKTVHIHPSYMPANAQGVPTNDIALIELTDSIQDPSCKLCLSDRQPTPGEDCIAFGFACALPTRLMEKGCTDGDVRRLVKEKANVLDAEQCTRLSHNATNHQETFCTGRTDDQGFCMFDSGSSLVCYDDASKSHYAAGVASFLPVTDSDSCVAGSMTVQYYTRISKYLPWIKSIVPDLN